MRSTTLTYTNTSPRFHYLPHNDACELIFLLNKIDWKQYLPPSLPNDVTKEWETLKGNLATKVFHLVANEWVERDITSFLLFKKRSKSR